MRRRIVFLLMVIASLTAKSEGTITLGYCNGEIASSSDYQLTGKGYQEAAVYLRSSALKAYAGNYITTIRVALVARVNIDTLHVWVRDGNMEQTLAAGTITRSTSPKISKGWNEVQLDTPLPITEDMGDILIGYTIHQNSTVKTISVVGEPMDNTSFVKLGDDDWQDISDKGVLSIEALISGDQIARYDYGFQSVQIAPNPSVSPTALSVKAVVHNYGTESPAWFSVLCQTDGIKPISLTLHEAIPSTRSETVTFGFDPGIETDEQTLWTFTIGELGGEPDEQPGNNSAQAKFTYQKNVLVEEFTTEQCVNCPRIASWLHEAIESDKAFVGRVFAVCHHAGYYTDWLTLPCDEELTWLYNENGNLYAPALMINRRAMFPNKYRTDDQPVATFLPASAEEMVSLFNEELERTANAIVGVSLDVDDDASNLKAHVVCKQNGLYKAAHPTLTVYLMEDDVKAKNQSGATGVYWQQHVIRRYNTTWGDEVTWDGNLFAADYTFEIDPSWNKEKLSVVAVLGNYDAANPANCTIENSAKASLVDDVEPEIPTSNDNHETMMNNREPTPQECCYDLQGRGLPLSAILHRSSQTKGAYLVRYADGSVKKVVIP